ncbi:tautomerase [Variovorax sp. GB1P17]|uniref:tautomerase n=1 Tax=Variovorax sp. GB1P17 TaxID=3443740 RepID=UPI003F46ABDA
MPHIVLKIPQDSFPGDSRATLVQKIREAASAAEQIPADPAKQFLCWVLIEEISAGNWTCGGADVTAKFLPCAATVQLPAGVLDEASRAQFIQLTHAAFKAAMPANDKRQLLSSVILHDVPNGTWGVGGAVWKLPDFARAAGYAHLQHLVEATA